MIIPTVNYLAIIAAAIAAMAVGFVWYSDMLFGKPWRKLSSIKFTKKDMDMQAMRKTYTFGAISTLITAYVLAVFLGILRATGLALAWQATFWLWLGFVAPIMYTEVIYGRRSFGYFLINVTYQLTALLIMALVLTWWV